jgi:hypothetical protein
VTILKSVLVKGALAAAVLGGTVVATTSASADVVCNRWGECWRVHDRLDYPAGLGITFHDDAWYASHRTGHWRWREDRFDRGYYRNGVWIAF